MMSLSSKTIYTVKDIYELPDGERAELIDGKIYNMEYPNRMHQYLLEKLSRKIGNYIIEHHEKGEVYIAPFAVFIENDEKNYVEPDISVICDLNKLDDRGCNGAPDWIIEIASSGSRRMDYLTKLFKYRSAGVREYWIVDPMRKSISVNYFEGGKLSVPYNFASTIKVNIYEDLYIDFSEIEQAVWS